MALGWRRTWIASILAGVLLLAAGSADARGASRPLTSGPRSAGATAAADQWVIHRATSPARTEVSDASGTLVAELTDGARTVPIAGPVRVWTEAGLGTEVSSDRWVRLLPASYDGVFDSNDATWLTTALADRSADVLAIAFQYATGAAVISAGGLRIAGDAAYGSAGSAGADFNDYLGVAWSYGTSVDQPERAEYGALDCSGYVRMVLGYRFGLAMSINALRGTLPRRAADQLANGPGAVIVANGGRQVASFGTLRPGDLVFFDASARDGTGIDHVGIYVGRDTRGRHRFISSRPQADGPTIGDVGSASVLDGTGYWAQAFRAIRRP